MRTKQLKFLNLLIVPIISTLLVTLLPFSDWTSPTMAAGVSQKGEKVHKKRRGPATRGLVKGVKGAAHGTKVAARATTKGATTAGTATASGAEAAAQATATGATTAGKSTAKGAKTVAKPVKKLF